MPDTVDRRFLREKTAKRFLRDNALHEDCDTNPSACFFVCFLHLSEMKVFFLRFFNLSADIYNTYYI